MVFNRDIQTLVARNVERAYLGEAPSLSNVQNTYGYEILISWLMTQLEDLNDYCGANTKMSYDQTAKLADVMTAECCRMKVTELHLFFYRFKAGHYGQFYGVVDPLKIMVAFGQFSAERIVEISKIQNKRQSQEIERKREISAKEAVSYDEYQRLKKLKENANKT